MPHPISKPKLAEQFRPPIKCTCKSYQMNRLNSFSSFQNRVWLRTVINQIKKLQIWKRAAPPRPKQSACRGISLALPLMAAPATRIRPASWISARTSNRRFNPRDLYWNQAVKEITWMHLISLRRFLAQRSRLQASMESTSMARTRRSGCQHWTQTRHQSRPNPRLSKINSSPQLHHKWSLSEFPISRCNSRLCQIFQTKQAILQPSTSSRCSRRQATVTISKRTWHTCNLSSPVRSVCRVMSVELQVRRLKWHLRGTLRVAVSSREDSHRNSLKRRCRSRRQRSNSMVIGVHAATKNFEFLASKYWLILTFNFLHTGTVFEFRGGVAVVWLGKKDGVNYAMKQFPKSGSGQYKFDPSAYVELQMAQLIRKYSTKEGESLDILNFLIHPWSIFVPVQSKIQFVWW